MQPSRGSLGPPHPAWHPIFPDVVSEHPELGAGHLREQAGRGGDRRESRSPTRAALLPWKALRSCLGAGAVPWWGRTEWCPETDFPGRNEAPGSPTWGVG